MENLKARILELLSTSSALTQSELANSFAEFPKETIFLCLLALWKEGKAFTSEVNVQSDGYFPTEQATWAANHKPFFFVYSPRRGAYQLGFDPLIDIELELHASINIGSPVYSIAVSPIDDVFVVGDDSGTLSLCNLTNAVIIKKVQAHQGRIWALDYSQGGNELASGSLDGGIALWNQGVEFEEMVGKTDDWVTSLKFSPDGSHILSAHKLSSPQHPSVRIWSLNKPISVQSYFHHPANVYGVEYLPDGDGFISAGSDSRIGVWSLERDQLVYLIKKHTGTVTCAAAHPSANTFASGGWTGTIKTWDTRSGSILQTIEAHSDRITSLKYGGFGRLLASGSKDSTIALWQIPEAILLSRTLPGQGWVRALAFDNSGLHIVSGSSDGYVRIWGIQRLGGT